MVLRAWLTLCIHLCAGVGVLLMLLWILPPAPAREERSATERERLAREDRPAGTTNTSGSLPRAHSPSAANPFFQGQRQFTVSDEDPHRLEFCAGYLPVRWNGQLAAGAEFHHVAVGDVTGDGRDDVIATATSDEVFWQLYVHSRTSTCNLGEPIRYKLDEAAIPVGLAAFDLNADGVDDVVLTTSDGLIFGLSDGRGGLVFSSAASVSQDLKHMGHGVVGLDLNGDGWTDLVGHLEVAYAHSYDRSVDRRSRLRVWFGDGRGGFTGSRDMELFGIEEGGEWGMVDVQKSTSMIADDFNGDGLTDLVVAAERFSFALQQNPRFLVVYLNDGQGGLVESQAIQHGLEYLTSIDLDGNRRRDLLGVSSWNSPYAQFHVYRQELDGRLSSSPAITVSTGEVPIAPVVTDLNGDGVEDVVLAFHGWGGFGFHLGREVGFSGPRAYGLAALGYWRVMGYTGNNGLAVIDVDGDRCKDVVIASRFDGLQLFRGRDCTVRRVTSTPLPPKRG